MSPFEHFKERRLAALFYFTFLVFLAVLAVGAFLHVLAENNDLPEDWPLILLGIGVAFLAFGVYWLRQRRRLTRPGRYQSSPLSRDEWAKARRKLSARTEIKRRR